MNTNAAVSSSDAGVDGTKLAALSLSSTASTGTQIAVTSTGDQAIAGEAAAAANTGSAKPSTYRQKNRSQFYRPRRDQGPGFYSSVAERGRSPRRGSFGRGGRPHPGYSFSTPSGLPTQSGSTQSGPSSAPASQKYVTRRRPPPRPENIKPNDVYVSLKSSYKAHCEKCKKLLDGKYSEIFIHALLDAIPVAINVAVELKKFFQGTVDFTSKTETVNLIDDLIPTDDATAPTFAKRKVSSIVIHVFRTVNIP